MTQIMRPETSDLSAKKPRGRCCVLLRGVETAVSRRDWNIFIVNDKASCVLSGHSLGGLHYPLWVLH